MQTHILPVEIGYNQLIAQPLAPLGLRIQIYDFPTKFRSVEPKDGVDLYFIERQAELATATLDLYRYRLNHFVD